MLVDSHCHLHMLDLALFDGQLDNVLNADRANEVAYFLNVCTRLADVDTIMTIARRYPQVGASVGIHPNEAFDSPPSDATLFELAANPQCVALGETGLDYYRTKDVSDQRAQEARFIQHIEVAKQLNKPLIIHSRAAPDDTLRLMKAHQAKAGVMHCFCEDWPMAAAAMECGFYISISGIVTFKNAQALQEVAQKVPLDRLLVETDCPYLAPMPFRGKPNQPAYVRHTALKIAELRGISYDEVAAATTQNFFDLFSMAERPDA